MRGMKEAFLNAGISRRGTAALIITNKKSIATMSENSDRYDSQGGLKPLLSIWAQPWLIEFTNFWLNPQIAITDKYHFARTRTQFLIGFFKREPMPTWIESVKKE